MFYWYITQCSFFKSATIYWDLHSFILERPSQYWRKLDNYTRKVLKIYINIFNLLLFSFSKIIIKGMHVNICECVWYRMRRCRVRPIFLERGSTKKNWRSTVACVPQLHVPLYSVLFSRAVFEEIVKIQDARLIRVESPFKLLSTAEVATPMMIRDCFLNIRLIQKFVLFLQYHVVL